MAPPASAHERAYAARGTDDTVRLTAGRLHCVRDSGYSAGLQETQEIMNIRTEAPERNNCRGLQLVELQRHLGELGTRPTGVFICRMLISE
jgi:hypothetical protein